MGLILIGSGCTGRKIDSQLKRAEELKGTRKFEEALQVYKLIITRYPTDEKTAVAYVKMGDLYLYTFNKEADALDSYLKVMDKWPLSEAAKEAAVKRAEYYGGKSDYTKSIAEYESALENFPNCPEKYAIRLKIAESYLNLQDAYQASIELGELLKNDDIGPEVHPKALFDLGESQLYLKRYEEALKTFKELEAKYPDFTLLMDARLHMIECLEGLENAEEAMKLQKKFSEIYPDSEPLKKKGEALMKREEKSEKPE